MTIGNNIFFTFDANGTGTNDTIELTLNGTDIGAYTLTPDSWVEYTTAQMLATSSSMTLSFIRTGSETSYIENVSYLEPPGTPEVTSFILVAPLCAILFLWLGLIWRKSLPAGR